MLARVQVHQEPGGVHHPDRPADGAREPRPDRGGVGLPPPEQDVDRVCH